MADAPTETYFQEIEAHFALRRGTPFILNAKDWALMKKWYEDGLPLPVVIEAIDAVFEKNETSVPKIEERLIDLERELVDAFVAADPSSIEAIRADIAIALGDTSKLDPKTRSRTEEANLRRLVREKF